MTTHLVEKKGDKYFSHQSVILPPENLSVLNSKMAMKIVADLSVRPGCAMDVSRSIKQHEQKVYYHMKRLEKAGIIKMAGTEKRYGMTANMYSPVSPVISAKLYEAGRPIAAAKQPADQGLVKFFRPFVENGKLNAKIILPDPYPHGKYDRGGNSSVHTFDIAMMLGNCIRHNGQSAYRMDTETSEDDLKENLILFASPTCNTMTEKFNEHMPVFFDPQNDWAVTSKATGKVYSEPRIGVIIKCDNPLSAGKKLLVLGGIRTRGMRAVSVALMKYTDKILEAEDANGNIVRIVEGLDRSGNKVIDDVKFLE
jgi:hypothetical protein